MLVPTRRPAARRLVPLAAAGALLALPVLSGCTDNTTTSSTEGSADPRALTVAASDTACAVSGTEAPSGKLTFSVTNSGSKINEFYLLAGDGLRILGEVENIGPGITRDLVLTAPAGSYFTACKPGMVGDGIRAPFTVAESSDGAAASTDDGELVAAANANYASYVRDQTDQLLSKTEEFAAAYEAGDDAKARALYPVARTHWERIETVAESFGDLDPKMDLREADLEQGQKWTGWHRIEKDLWPARAKGYTALSTAQRTTYADDLVKNTKTLHERTRDMTFTVDQIANGSRGLLDEVATGKVTGEEEYWSRTDLYDFQANVDGARIGFEGLRPILATKDKALDSQLETRFTALQTLLDQQKSGDGFKNYDDVSKSDIKALSDAVNALAEPLSKLTAAVS
ncbi:iron uptake system component EfeO [Microlunatus sagamiharensis]|uniref:Iron uptake system component EfeO n=1 Tax=Microlunatus sagamiharensis TaxID=546874 RepID=A0A1H2N6Y8_9ACTN|nr:iron uptake system protein EfeO [Microlunatus sagamiharensis]SDV00556.1 iron uptake system component EfeO [Microlunatus sagamiharensis]